MLRRLFTFLSVLSLLLCAALCATWVRSGAADGRVGSVYIEALGGRYTLDWRDDRLILTGPPPMAPATLEQGTTRTRWFPTGKCDPWKPEEIPACLTLPNELVAAMRNEDLMWQIYLFDGRPPRTPNVRDHASPRGRPGTATSDLAPRGEEDHYDDLCVDEAHPAFPPWRLPPYTLAQTGKLLLAALEDEDRWIAAHVALAWIAGSDEEAGIRPRSEWPPFKFRRDASSPDRYEMEMSGLHAELHAHGSEKSYICCYRAPQDGRTRECRPTIDPSQRARLVDWWHRRLGVQVVAADGWLLAVATLGSPALWIFIKQRSRTLRRRRRRAGCCEGCGFDLRASSGRCPECGSPGSMMLV